MEFTSIERISIAAILLGMMNADNDVDIREILYFNQIQNTLGIANSEFEQGKTQNLLVSLLVIKGMTEEKKVAVGYMLFEMIQADNKEDEREIKLLELISETTGLKNVLLKLANIKR